MNYTIEMCVANIKHKEWWNGAAIIEFETIQDVISFIRSHIPVKQRDIDFIIENDKNKSRGRLACTSWYSVRKGDPMMTEYTSF